MAHTAAIFQAGPVMVVSIARPPREFLVWVERAAFAGGRDEVRGPHREERNPMEAPAVKLTGSHQIGKSPHVPRPCESPNAKRERPLLSPLVANGHRYRDLLAGDRELIAHQRFRVVHLGQDLEWLAEADDQGVSLGHEVERSAG